MKHLVSLCLSICITFPNLKAQNADFAPVGAKWYYSQSSFDYPYPEEYRIVEVTAEVAFQGKLCRKIEGGVGCGLPDPCYVFTRNDSTFFWSAFTDDFELLYDFRAQVGDSWLIKGMFPFGDSLRVFVEATGQKVVGGDTLKTWSISQSGCYDWGEEIVERVGNICYLSPSFCLCENGPCGVRCYLDGLAAYQFVPFPCDTVINWLSVPEPSAPLRLRANPNPATAHTYLVPDREMEGSHCAVSLFDQQGRLVREQAFRVQGGQPVRVTLEGLPPGVYAYRVLTERGELGAGKVMVGQQ